MKVVLRRDVFTEIVKNVSDRMLTKLKAIDPKITGVHFEYGHYTDIQERLQTYSKDPAMKSSRFPLIAMFEDDRVRHGFNRGMYGMSNFKVLILAQSKKEYTRVQRDDNVFKPILYPIYEVFLDEVAMSGYFMVYDAQSIEHDQVDRPHWGDPALYGNTAYLFTDVLDGIELSNFNLPTYSKICDAIGSDSGS
jgi:hypothetical protein